MRRATVVVLAVLLAGCGSGGSASTRAASSTGDLVTLEQLVGESVAAVEATVTAVDWSGDAPTAHLWLTDVVFGDSTALWAGADIDLQVQPTGSVLGLDPDVVAGLPDVDTTVFVLLAGDDPYRPTRGFQGVWTLSDRGASNADPARSWTASDDLAGQVRSIRWQAEHGDDPPAATTSDPTALHPVQWGVDEAHPSQPGDTSVTLLVREQDCSDGTSVLGRLQTPGVEYTATQITFYLWATGWTREVLCPPLSNGWESLVVQLPGPVGDRVIVMPA